MFKRSLFSIFTIIFAIQLYTSISFCKVKEGQVFPKFSLKQLQTNNIINSEQFKNKVIILDFWASWCEPCKVEIPILNKISQKYQKQGLIVVGINEDKELSEAQNYIKDLKVQFLNLEDGLQTELLTKLDLSGLPATYVLDKQFKVHKIHKGFKEEDQAKLEKEIQALLKAK